MAVETELSSRLPAAADRGVLDSLRPLLWREIRSRHDAPEGYWEATVRLAAYVDTSTALVRKVCTPAVYLGAPLARDFAAELTGLTVTERVRRVVNFAMLERKLRGVSHTPQLRLVAVVGELGALRIRDTHLRRTLTTPGSGVRVVDSADGGVVEPAPDHRMAWLETLTWAAASR